MKHLLYLTFGILLLAGCSGPKAIFSYDQEEKAAPSRVTFENKSEKAEAYSWDFGDGSTSEDPSPDHRYTHSGKYTIVLEAKKGKRRNISKKEILVEAPSTCLVAIETPMGNMIVQLSDATPGHRDNFVKLAEEGFYDSLLFHRVIDGFMLQGGDPQSRNAAPGQPLGSGGPGYQIPAEFVDSLVHVKGAIAAARTGDAVNPEKKSSGSQFYIVQGKPVDKAMLSMMENRNGFRYTEDQKDAYLEFGGTPFLDRNYTVFGHVVEGMEVIDRIAAVKTGRGDRPETDIWMKVHVIK